MSYEKASKSERELLAKRAKLADQMVAVSKTDDTEEFRRLAREHAEINTLITRARNQNYSPQDAGNRSFGSSNMNTRINDRRRTLRSLKRDKHYVRNDNDAAFTRYLRNETSEYRASLDANALSTTGVEPGVAGSTGYSAGYMIPQGFWQNLQIALKAYGGLSALYRLVESDTGNPMPWPTVDPTGIVAGYLTEMQGVGFGGDGQGHDYAFGQGMLNAWTIVSGMILASVQLIQDSAFDVDGFVADRIGEAIGRKIAAEAYSGTGSGAMLGINTALAARGTTGTVGSGSIAATGGYVQLATGGTYKRFDGTGPTELASNCISPLTAIAMVSSVDPAYYANSVWVMNAQQAWNLRGVSDANYRPLLNFANGLSADNVRAGNYTQGSAVAEMLGFPVIIDNSVANLTASTASGPLFGDFSAAMVMRLVRGDGSGIRTMRLTERYADYLQVGYIGYLRGDIRSNDLRAAVTVKPAAT
jgi:HK97 family phage major capsid protein